MKKALSLVLAIIMLLSCVPLCASAAKNIYLEYPTIYFRGNGETIYDENGEQVYDFDFDTSLVPEMAKTILPDLLAGYITDNFTQYYKTFEAEMSKVYDRCQLDENGNPKYGTGISAVKAQRLKDKMSSNYYDSSCGGYEYEAYSYHYDWRLDPIETVDKVDAYIDAVLAVTGKDKVNLISKCLGGNIILTYLAKYGSSKINAIGFGSTVANGCNLIDDIFAGDVVIDSAAVEKFVNDDFIKKVYPADMFIPFELASETVSLLAQTGTLGVATDIISTGFYKRVYKGLVPAIVRASYGTWPGYWAMVTADRYESTRDFIFGQDGGEQKEKYKVLIEKLDNYDKLVRQHIPEILKKAEADGVKIAITSKYGFQMPPVIKTADEQGDVWTSAKLSSFGGTLSKTGTTLSKEYLEERTALGYGKYLSPDNQVDASTCLFPQYTWFIKGAIHDDWSDEENQILCNVLGAKQQLTVDTMTGYPQFLVYDRETDTTSPMTKDNCGSESYDVDNTDQSSWNTLHTLFKWLSELFKLLIEKIKAYVPQPIEVA